MAKKQHSIVVSGYWDEEGDWEDSTEDLNEYLEDGWRVVTISPMGSFGYGSGEGEHGFASLVILEKD